VFNILIGNTDDHTRNHAAFWDGHLLTVTPAYDICPQARHGQIATQAMLIKGDDRSSRITTCLAAALKAPSKLNCQQFFFSLGITGLLGILKLKT